jgi:hypothetical protein
MTGDAAAAEPVTSNDRTSNDVAGEHVTGDEPPREHPLWPDASARSLAISVNCIETGH